MPNRYRKKATEVEAVQWTGENREEVEEFAGGRSLVFNRDGAIRLWSGIARPGDFIYRDEHGTCRPVPSAEFEATYEPVGERGELEGLVPAKTREAIRRAAANYEEHKDIPKDKFPGDKALYLANTVGFLGGFTVQLLDALEATEQQPASSQPVLDVDLLREKLLSDEVIRSITQQIVEESDGEVVSLPYSVVREAVAAALSDLEGRDGDR